MAHIYKARPWTLWLIFARGPRIWDLKWLDKYIIDLDLQVQLINWKKNIAAVQLYATLSDASSRWTQSWLSLSVCDITSLELIVIGILIKITTFLLFLCYHQILRVGKGREIQMPEFGTHSTVEGSTWRKSPYMGPLKSFI